MPDIIHIDMDCFFAAVEVKDNPDLAGKPVIVGALPGSRGVVSAASYEARAYGIHSAQPISRAFKNCPHGVYLRPNGKRYMEESERIMSIFRRFTPLVEPLSLDEAFLDVTGSHRLFGSSKEIGSEIKMVTKPKLPLLQVFRTRSFWVILFIWLVMAFSSFFIMTHIVPHAIDIGFSPVESATILSFGGIAMIAGRLFAGIISDRVSAKGVAVVSSLIQFAAILSLVWGRELWMLYLFGLVHGLTFGSFGTSITVLIGRTFDLDDIGKVLGILEVGIFIGGAIGPYLGGLIFDTTGSYSLAFVVTGTAVLLRILLVALVKPGAPLEPEPQLP